MSKQQSYVQQVFDMLVERGLRPGAEITVGMVHEYIGWARGDALERARFQAAVSDLARPFHGVLERTDRFVPGRKGHPQRVYRIVDLSPSRRPHRSAHKQGINRVRKSRVYRRAGQVVGRVTPARRFAADVTALCKASEGLQRELARVDRLRELVRAAPEVRAYDPDPDVRDACELLLDAVAPEMNRGTNAPIRR